VCHSDVIQLPKDVWYLKITQYADRLLSGLDTVDYPDSIKQQEIEWIGKSTGAFVNFTVKGVPETLEIYTTRCDTLFGVTFMVMAPEHPLLDKYKDRIENWAEVEAYRAACAKKTEFERTQLVKDKTGVRLKGFTAINPVNRKEIPIFIADYVMMGYGTGAIMAVPAHDERDWAFARKFGVDIIPVIEGGDIDKAAYTGNGPMINSDFLNVYDNKKDSIAAMLRFLEEKGLGHKGVQYKMKDWAFNRQRYWGEPIPLIHCPKCGTVGVPYDQLPLTLPDVENFEPGTDGQSPLARIDSFVNCTCPKCGGPAKRETDTMPQWAGSSWYYLRFIDPHNDQVFCDKEKMKYWMPVDWYNGGMEHVTRHLLYSRFWHQFLYDIQEVNTPEPYAKRTYQGLILGPDGDKMSKSKGNVVDPIDVIDRLGADTLRTYVMFMGDYMAATPWSEQSANGCKRFLDRVWRLQDMIQGEGETKDMRGKVHGCVKKVTDDIEHMKFNTAIAAMMSLVNDFYAKGSVTRDELHTLLVLLDPFAPHMAEEMNEALGYETPLYRTSWPTYEESALVADTVEYGIQVNGKVRARIALPADLDKSAVEQAALSAEPVQPFLSGKTVRKVIVVKNIVNIVVG
jgi:leucyl-tRNA synthetase